MYRSAGGATGPGASRQMLCCLLLLLNLEIPGIARAGPGIEIAVTRHDGTPVRWQAELAATPRERLRGLMWRRELAAGTGMLLDFGKSERVAMWMQDTFVPLDMIFITADGRIADIRRDCKPLSTTIVHSAGEVRYVLEINAGEAAGLGTGDAVTIRDLP